jgi:hypothetical protein
VRDELVDIGGVDVQPHDVGQGHFGGAQHVLQVVERELELRGHVARVLGVAVGVHRVLPAAHEQPLVPLDELGLVEAQVHGPGGGVDRGSSRHVVAPLVVVTKWIVLNTN